MTIEKQLMPFVLAALVTSGCNWNAFDDIIDEASARVYDVPSDYRKSNYGSVLTSLQLDAGKSSESTRLIASAGSDSPIVFQTVWKGDELSERTGIRCKKKNDCEKGQGVGAVLIPFPVWGKTTPEPQTSCALTPGIPNAYVLCESNVRASQNYALNLSEVETDKAVVHFSGASLPESYPLGVVLIGAHSVRNLDKQPVNGTLFYQPDMVGTEKGNVPKNKVFAIVDPATGEQFGGGEQGKDFGYAVATFALAGNKVLVAVSQPANNRVIVAEYDPAIDATGVSEAEAQAVRTHTLACVNSPDGALTGFGKVLLLGDVNDDGKPELFAGVDPNDGKNQQALYAFDGAGLPAYDEAATSCAGWGSAGVEVACKSGVNGVACQGSQFGAALAVGDVNADGTNDLIVGAPRAKADGKKDAGTVFIIPGSDGGLDLDGMANVYATGLEKDARLGTSVTVVHTRDRDEPAAGAPGQDALYLFMCTTLEGEKPSTLCLPKK